MRKTEWGWAANLLTASSLFFGFWAIIQVVEGNYLLACWLIIFAAICDGLDGKLARFTKSSSEMGIELDSLVDSVSFGVAPSVMLYLISFQKFGFAGMILAIFPLFFGVVRLARFNCSATIGEKRAYCGLPIPMQAITIATFILFNHAIWGDLRLEILLIPLTVVLAFLMISHISYDSMPRFTFWNTRKNLAKLIVIFLGIILIALNPPLIFFPLIMLYLLKGIGNSIWKSVIEEDDLEEVVEDEELI